MPASMSPSRCSPTAPVAHAVVELRIIEHSQQELADLRVVGLDTLLAGLVSPVELPRGGAAGCAVDHLELGRGV